MRANVSVLTANAKDVIGQNIADYQNSVAAHISGDWGGHNQMMLYVSPYAEPVSGHNITNAYLLRVQLTGTDAGGVGDGAFTMPAISSGIVVDAGAPPVVLQQPSSLSVTVGKAAAFSVVMASAGTVAYQWLKNGAGISGASAATYVIPSAQTTHQGAYTVAGTNAYGYVTSSAANLTVNAAAAASTGGSTGGTTDGIVGCFVAGTRITLADGTTRNIEDMRAGDVVKSYSIIGLDPANEESWITFASASLSATPTTATVVNTIKLSYTYYYKILDLSLTWEHPLLVRRNGIWRFFMAKDIVPGDFLWRNGIPQPIDVITRVDENFDAYNIDTEVEDTYVANGYIAHNPTESKA